jgi:hypothetical protein
MNMQEAGFGPNFGELQTTSEWRRPIAHSIGWQVTHV